MASRSLSDSIWAPGNEAKRYNRQVPAGTPVCLDRTQGGPGKLSTASNLFNPNTATNSEPPWSNENVQPHTMTPKTVASTSANMWGANKQQLAYTDHNNPGVVPHLLAPKDNDEANLPSQLQTSDLNTPSGTFQEHNFAAIPNTSPGPGSPQTPKQNRSSISGAIWHISPQSEVKYPLGTHIPVAEMQWHKQPNKDTVEHKQITPQQLYSAPHNHHPRLPIASVEKNLEEGNASEHRLTEEPHQVQAHEIPKDNLQVIPSHSVETPQNLSANERHFMPSSLDNTDAFLAYMQRKVKDGPVRSKRYVAFTSEAGMGQVLQHSHAIKTPHKENIQLSTTTTSVKLAPTGLQANPQDDIGGRTASLAGSRDGFHQNEKSLAGQTGRSQIISVTVKNSSVPADVVSVGAEATQDWTQSIADHPMPQNFSDLQLQQAKDIHKALFSEIMAKPPVNPNAPKLTEESLIQNGGWPARVRSEDSFCDKISDAGVEIKKENVRASQGRDAAEELQNKASWYPNIPDWEQKNWALDASYIPTYIQQDWLPFIADGKDAPVDMNKDGFRLGKLPVNDRVLGAEVVQPNCIPDIENSENEEKRLRQTVELDCLVFTKKRAKRYKGGTEHQGDEGNARYKETISREPAPHPYAPSIPIYLRPITNSDVSMVRALYNYYVKNSIITEDHVEVDDIDIQEITNACRNEHLPFIVAVKGKAPVQPQGYGKSSKLLLPKFETILGFGFAQTYAYGFRGKRDGRSRATVDIQFYVHHEYTRKGVGRSLLDRLIQSLSHSYAGKDGYEWINPTNDSIYDCTRLWHQLVIQMPIEVKDDTKLTWITEFLAKYWFDQEARLKRFGRTSIHGGDARFIDMVIFAKSASVEMEYHPFL